MEALVLTGEEAAAQGAGWPEGPARLLRDPGEPAASGQAAAGSGG
jgi:hypothetical protein